MTTKVAKLQRACLVSPVKVEVAAKYSTVDTLRQQYLFIPAKYKDCYLAFVLNELSGSTAMVSGGQLHSSMSRGASRVACRSWQVCSVFGMPNMV